MAGTSEKIEADLSGWTPLADVLQKLDSEGISVTSRQLERWRNEKLLPDVQQQKTPGHGSIVWLPPGSIEHIKALVSIRPRRVDHVGWELWWRGYPVGDRHWRPAMVKISAGARRNLQLVARMAKLSPRRVAAEFENQIPLGHNGGSSIDPNGTLIRQSFGRLNLAELIPFMRMVSEVVAGNHVQFADDEDGDISASLDLTMRVMRLENSDDHTVFDKRIRSRQTLPDVFRVISDRCADNTFLTRYETATDAEIFIARDEARDALETGRNLHEALAWAFGPNAFGLGLARAFHDLAPRSVKLILISGWLDLRTEDGMFLNSDQIQDLQIKSAEVVQLSKRLREIAAQQDFKEVITPAKLKRAFKNYDNQSDFIREIKRARSS